MTIYRLFVKMDSETPFELDSETTELDELVEDAFDMARDEFAVQITHNDPDTSGDYSPGLVAEWIEGVLTNLRVAVDLHPPDCEGC